MKSCHYYKVTSRYNSLKMYYHIFSKSYWDGKIRQGTIKEYEQKGFCKMCSWVAHSFIFSFLLSFSPFPSSFLLRNWLLQACS